MGLEGSKLKLLLFTVLVVLVSTVKGDLLKSGQTGQSDFCYFTIG